MESGTRRWVYLLTTTLVIGLVAYTVIPAFATDGFRWVVFLAAFGPVVWALVLLFISRGRRERLICCLGFVIAVLPAWALWDNILQLLMRR